MRVIRIWLLVFGLTLVAGGAHAEKRVRVFVALCDNATQGIIPVGEKIGNGDDPDANLYWGCDDGFGSYFSRSKRWKVIEKEKDVSDKVLRRMKLEHNDGGMVIEAEAYRGSRIKDCLMDFEKAVASGEYDLVAYIGHNGLMEHYFPVVKSVEDNKTEAFALACVSQSYFTERFEKLGAEPILLTTQLMYPGAFVLHDVIEAWAKGGTKEEIRAAAGKAYAKNQGISVKSATGVFAKLE